jgi:hypothetical protein
MTSSAKITSNRANARASTGPKSKSGRRLASRNALCHGLSVSIEHDPTVSEEVHKLACEIAGQGATAELHDLALRVAQAQVDIQRVRLAQQQFLSRALSEPDQRKRRVARKARGKALPVLLDLRAAKSIKSAISNSPLMDSPTQPWTLATVLAQEIKRLGALDRYEKRALSRRKSAIRALDAARAATDTFPQ